MAEKWNPEELHTCNTSAAAAIHVGGKDDPLDKILFLI